MMRWLLMLGLLLPSGRAVAQYAGGDGDGYAGALRPAGPFPGMVNPYAGGDGDGYAAASVVVPSLTGGGVALAARARDAGVTLTWTAAGPGPFEVQMHAGPRTDGAAWQVLGTAPDPGEGAVWTFHVDALPPGIHTFRLRRAAAAGRAAYSPAVEAVVGPAPAFVLSAVYPNPVHPRAAFTLQVPRPMRVRVAVYDVQGRQVALLHAGPLGADGPHVFTFDGTGLAAGLYVVRAEGAERVATRRLVLVR